MEYPERGPSAAVPPGPPLADGEKCDPGDIVQHTESGKAKDEAAEDLVVHLLLF